MSLDDIDLDETEDFLTVSQHLGNRDAEESESLLDALLRISATADRAEMGAVSWEPAVACVAEFSPDEPQVVEVALALLAKLALANQSMCDANLVELVLRVMSENGADEPTLQEQCCLLVKGLGEGCAANSELMRTAGVEAALDAALGKIQNVRNQKYVAEAKAALADA
jgi:hypothetical protein